MDVILLAAGIGERLRPLSFIYPKPVVPIVGKPIIARLMESFKEVGCENFIIVKSEEGGAMVEAATSSIEGAHVQYVLQDPPKGMGDAFRCVKEQVSELPHEFILSATDVLYNIDGIQALVDQHTYSGADATLGLLFSSDTRFARGHGNVAVESNLGITQIVEKPGQNNILSNYYSMPTYIFTDSIFDMLDQVPLSSRGEIELQDAIQFLIDRERPIQGAVIIPGDIKFEDVGKYHITTVADFLKMNLAYLKGINLPQMDENPTIIEPVVIEEGSIIGGSCFIGPRVYVGAGCTLGNFVEVTDSILLENATIGEHAKMQKCVVLPGSVVPANARLAEKIITEDQNIPLIT